MKVYLIVLMNYDGSDDIFEAYSTREKAEAVVDKIKNTDDVDCLGIFIREIEVKE